MNEIIEIKGSEGGEGGREGAVTCVYRTWESQTGWAARIVKRMYLSRLQEAFKNWAAELKEFAEKEKDDI